MNTVSNYYIYYNLSICEKNCDYKEYNNDTKKVLCECKAKTIFLLISEVSTNKDKLLKNFKEIKNLININVMKCFYTLFTINGLIKNIGSYVIALIILLTIILAIIFKLRGLNKINLQINELIKTADENNKNININDKCDFNNKVKSIAKIKESKGNKKVKKVKHLEAIKAISKHLNYNYVKKYLKI